MALSNFIVKHLRINLLIISIDIVTRLCSFLRLVGWTEKAVSLSQALLDLCYKRPDGLSSSPLTWLKSLWEQSGSRFGEEDSGSSAAVRTVHGIDCKILKILCILYDFYK